VFVVLKLFVKSMDNGNEIKKNSQFYNFSFTIFENAENFVPPDLESNGLNYIVYQLERNKETDRLHVQGYAQSKKRLSLLKVKRLFNCDSIRIEKAFRSFIKNKSLCTKEQARASDLKNCGPFEIGLPRTGRVRNVNRRKNVKAILKDIENGLLFEESESVFSWDVGPYETNMYDRVMEKIRYGISCDEIIENWNLQGEEEEEEIRELCNAVVCRYHDKI
jgi:hypothetical protein